jgi:predicted RNase H-like nuclease (RuvC/YqgF family)
MTTAEILHLLKQTNQFEPYADVCTSDVVDAIEALQAEHERMQTKLQNSITRRQEQMAAADFAVASLKEENNTLRQQLYGAQARTGDVMKELLWMRQWMRKDEAKDGVVISNAVGYQWSKWIDRVDAIKEALKGTA